MNRITKEQAEQANLEREIARKADRLLQIRKRIDALNKVKYECDKALLETESTFVHVSIICIAHQNLRSFNRQEIDSTI